jgi:hypothetical protein
MGLTSPVAVYGTEHTLTVCIGGRVLTTAVATSSGWHVSLGRIPHGPKRVWNGVAYQPVRCHWWTARDREQAIDWLRYIGVALHTGRAS